MYFQLAVVSELLVAKPALVTPTHNMSIQGAAPTELLVTERALVRLVTPMGQHMNSHVTCKLCLQIACHRVYTGKASPQCRSTYDTSGHFCALTA